MCFSRLAARAGSAQCMLGQTPTCLWPWCKPGNRHGNHLKTITSLSHAESSHSGRFFNFFFNISVFLMSNEILLQCYLCHLAFSQLHSLKVSHVSLPHVPASPQYEHFLYLSHNNNLLYWIPFGLFLIYDQSCARSYCRQFMSSHYKL